MAEQRADAEQWKQRGRRLHGMNFQRFSDAGETAGGWIVSGHVLKGVIAAAPFEEVRCKSDLVGAVRFQNFSDPDKLLRIGVRQRP